MINENQQIIIKWNNKLIKHYMSLGYPKLKPKEEFVVKIKDLPKNSNHKVPVSCDICGSEVQRSYNQAKNSKTHYCSKECKKTENKHTKEFLILEFNRFFKEKGYYPQVNEMQVQSGYPSYYYYIKLWGSWSNFIDEMGIIESGRWLNEDVQTLIDIYEDSPREMIESRLINKFSWSNIQLKARELGLTRKYKEPSTKGYTEDFLISEFWRYYDEFGIYPRIKDMTNNKDYPSEAGYKRIWGTWDNFLKTIGVVSKNTSDGWYICDENVLKEKYTTGKQEEIISSLMVKRKWGMIIAKASKLGLKRDKTSARRVFTDEFLINELNRYVTEFGKTPTHSKFEENKDYPSATVYKKRFGTWNNALQIAGLEINTLMQYDKEMIIKEVMKFYKNNERSPYYNELFFNHNLIKHFWNSWNHMLTDLGLPVTRRETPFENKKDGIDFLKRISTTLQKTPTTQDVNNFGVSDAWFTKKFGSFRTALFEAGLVDSESIHIENNFSYLIQLSKMLNRVPNVQEYEEFLKLQKKDYYSREDMCRKLKKSYLDICFEFLSREILESEDNNYFLNLKKERCRSLQELKISNLLIVNGISYTYEPYYKDVIENMKKNYKFDWKIRANQKDIYVEYFGYVKTSKEHNDFIDNYVNRANEKITICKNNNINLISLFPNDLKNNFSGLINKFNAHGIKITIFKDDVA